MWPGSPHRNLACARVVYEVDGTASYATLTVTNEDGGKEQNEVKLPFELKLYARIGQYLYLSAQKVRVTGTVHTSTGDRDIVLYDGVNGGVHVLIKTSGMVSDDDIAAKMGLEEGRFRQLSLIGCAADLLSLDSHNDPCTSDGNPETAAEWHQVNQAIRALPAPEREVILGFLEGRSLGEIGHSVGLSVGRVSQMKLQAIGRLRIALGARSRDPLRCDI